MTWLSRPASAGVEGSPSEGGSRRRRLSNPAGWSAGTARRLRSAPARSAPRRSAKRRSAHADRPSRAGRRAAQLPVGRPRAGRLRIGRRRQGRPGAAPGGPGIRPGPASLAAVDQRLRAPGEGGDDGRIEFVGRQVSRHRRPPRSGRRCPGRSSALIGNRAAGPGTRASRAAPASLRTCRRSGRPGQGGSARSGRRMPRSCADRRRGSRNVHSRRSPTCSTGHEWCSGSRPAGSDTAGRKVCRSRSRPIWRRRWPRSRDPEQAWQSGIRDGRGIGSAHRGGDGVGQAGRERHLGVRSAARPRRGPSAHRRGRPRRRPGSPTATPLPWSRMADSCETTRSRETPGDWSTPSVISTTRFDRPGTAPSDAAWYAATTAR